MSPLFPNHSRDDALQSRAVLDFTTMWLFGLVSYHEISKVFDEVRLIGISQLHYHPRPIYHFAFGQSFSHFVESIAFDHPLRTDTDILPEEPLQRPFVEVELAHDVINFGDLSMSDDTINDLVNEPDMLILLRKSLAKEIFCECYHLSFVLS